jgi:hypothetical protein
MIGTKRIVKIESHLRLVPELTKRSGQIGFIERKLDETENDPECETLYKVRFPDGFVGDVFESELIELNSIYVLYKCDFRHTPESMESIAFCSTQEKAIELAIECAKNDGEQISEHDLYLLRNISQTQNHEGSGEFVIRDYSQDILYSYQP